MCFAPHSPLIRPSFAPHSLRVRSAPSPRGEGYIYCLIYVASPWGEALPVRTVVRGVPHTVSKVISAVLAFPFGESGEG